MTTPTYLHPKPDAHLLIVDDEPNIRSALGRALSLLGYTVDEAGTGQEALAMLQRASFDLIVLDLRMPGMDGLEVMLRAHQLYPELLIIILTGHATMESAIAAVKSEAVDYLQKPASIQEIAEAVTRSLEKRAGQIQRRRLVQVMGEALEALRRADQPLSAGSIPADTQNILYLPPLKLDRQKRLLMITGAGTLTLQLTEGETVVLASLMMCPDRVLSCRDLIELGWGYSTNEREAQNIIRPHVSRLRGKINRVIPASSLIHTVRKRGYVLQTF
jgi:DNA-binding response OmpR family regulator